MSVFWPAIGDLAGEDAAVPAVRALVFLFAVFASMAWARRRPLLSLSCLCLGALLSLGFRLAPMVSPLGFGTDPEATTSWAQAGVNALAEPKGEGFITGTSPTWSLVAILASAGVPLGVVQSVPQASALLGLALLALMPFGLLRNRSTAAFASVLAVSGGLWPGALAYGALLLWPFGLVIVVGVFGLGQLGWFRKGFHRHRLSAAFLAIAASVFAQAAAGGGEASVPAALLMVAAALSLASPVRAVLRARLVAARAARRAEALTLLCVFGGAGVSWWDPAATVPGYLEATDANEALLRPMGWIHENVPPESVVLASPQYSAAVAALGGRRVLLPPAAAEQSPPLPEPFRRARLFESARAGRPIARLADAFSATHLFLGPGEDNPKAEGESASEGEPSLRLVLVYEDVKNFRIFRLVKK